MNTIRTADHTLRAFDEDLDAITAELMRMGGLAESEVSDANRAMAEADLGLAQSVISRDVGLDALEHQIKDQVARLIVKRQPVADDLRRAMAAIKISTDLERCGDLAKNIAKRTIVINQTGPHTPITGSIARMGDEVCERLKMVLDAVAAKDVEAAVDVWRRDAEIDAAYDTIFRELLTYMMADARTITACAHLLFVAKNLERIGDHATNIAETLHYQVLGFDIGDERPRSEGAGHDAT